MTGLYPSLYKVRITRWHFFCFRFVFFDGKDVFPLILIVFLFLFAIFIGLFLVVFEAGRCKSSIVFLCHFVF